MYPIPFGATNTNNTTSDRWLYSWIHINGSPATTRSPDGYHLCGKAGTVLGLTVELLGGALASADITFSIEVDGSVKDTFVLVHGNATGTKDVSVPFVRGSKISVKMTCSAGDATLSGPRCTLMAA